MCKASSLFREMDNDIRCRSEDKRCKRHVSHTGKKRYARRTARQNMIIHMLAVLFRSAIGITVTAVRPAA